MGSNVSFYNFFVPFVSFVLFVVKDLKLTAMGLRGHDGWMSDNHLYGAVLRRQNVDS